MSDLNKLICSMRRHKLETAQPLIISASQESCKTYAAHLYAVIHATHYQSHVVIHGLDMELMANVLMHEVSRCDFRVVRNGVNILKEGGELFSTIRSFGRLCARNADLCIIDDAHKEVHRLKTMLDSCPPTARQIVLGSPAEPGEPRNVW